MKNLFTLICATAITLLATENSFSQQQISCCPNAGFEDTTWTGWQCYIGTAPTPVWTLSGPVAPLGNNVPPGATSNANRHTLMWTQGQAPGCYLSSGLPDPLATLIAPGGGNVSAYIGNAQNGNGAERITYTMMVDSCNMGFNYSYQIVLDDPGHDSLNQPSFWVEILDQNGNIVTGPCGSYVVAAGFNDSGFIQNPTTAPYPWTYAQYLPWMTVGIDLSPYLGTQVTLTYSVKDCGYGGHWGLAYVDAGCSLLAANAQFCPGGSGAIVLLAPSGYATYQWFDPQGNPIPNSNNDTLIFTGPAVIGDVFTVNMVSAANCPTTLVVTLVPSTITATTSTVNAVCYGAPCLFTTTPNSGIPGFTFTWNTITGIPIDSMFSNGGTITNNLPAGTYVLVMEDTLGCKYYDTITVTQPPQPQDTLNTTMYFCDGDSMAYLQFPLALYNNIQQPAYLWQTYPGGQFLPNQLFSGDSTENMWVFGYPTAGSQYYFTWYMNGCQHKSVVTLDHQIMNPYFKPDSSANIFTPNGDNKNDLFNPFYNYMTTLATVDILGNPVTVNYVDEVAYYTKEYTLKVYNRWGNLEYETTDYTEAWDGKKNGKPMPDGVYFWVASYKNRCAPETDPPVELTGFVHLMK